MINYYYNIVKNYTDIDILSGIRRYTDCWKVREVCTQRYSWAIPSPKAIDAMRKYLPIYEIGAGTGYWARLVTNSYDSKDYYAYDLKSRNGYTFTKNWYKIRHKKLKNSNRTLFLCWPPYATTMAYDAIIENQPDKLIYIGEGYGGCTGDDKFHEILENNYEEIEGIAIPQFMGIHDYMTVYKKKNTIIWPKLIED